MLNLSEKEIEEIIYTSSYLINERYSIPNISGSQGQKGRQVNIGKSNSRLIDLLFKDTKNMETALCIYILKNEGYY